MEPIIQVQGVSKSYWRDRFEIPVLNNISFDIPAGEIVTFAPQRFLQCLETSLCVRMRFQVEDRDIASLDVV